MARVFGFVQFDFAGGLPLADGRYLVRDGDGERVLVVRTMGAARAGGRRRRARASERGAPPSPLPLTRVTVVRALAPFEGSAEAGRWLEAAIGSEEDVDRLVAEGIGVVNRALHVRAVASADPHETQLAPERAVAVRLGYGSGEETAEGGFAEAREVDVGGAGSRRRRRRQELQPQERLAAVLGGREEIDACETLLLRARADLDAGRTREAALQLRAGLEALLVELPGAVSDPGHERDMGILVERREEAVEIAEAALPGEPSAEQAQAVRDLLEVCERVLRRRRVLRG